MRAEVASKLYVEEQGDGDPLLLIEGLGQAMWAWREQVPVFARQFRTIAFDTRGTGRSPVPEGLYSIADLAEDAAGILAGRRAHVVALSMGGYVALTLALARPDLVRSLVLTGTGAGGPDRVPRQPHVRRVFAEVHATACYGYYAAGCEVERIETPALVVHGDEDLIVPVENGRMRAGRLSNAEYVELAGRGHNVMLEDPETFNGLVLDFLSRSARP